MTISIVYSPAARLSGTRRLSFPGEELAVHVDEIVFIQPHLEGEGEFFERMKHDSMYLGVRS
ncbi:hypothetical protein Barb6_00366 [Bacteroidales bacterium Barb6]|nr:hypothetical protein Barb6_00366 [Bacteroidales bacterium Barb6]